MVYPSGHHDDLYTARQPGRASTPSAGSLARGLSLAIVGLAVASYGFGFGPGGGAGAAWSIRFAVFAGLVAGLGLLPRQSAHGVIVAALAAAGFLDGLAVLLTADARWALTVIVVLNAIQAMLAVAALLVARNTETRTEYAQYAAYVEYYNQATQQYYAQQTDPRETGADHVGARGGATVAPGRTDSTAYGPQQPARYATYEEYAQPHPPSPGRSSGPADVDPARGAGARADGFAAPGAMPDPGRSTRAAHPPWHDAGTTERSPGG